MAFMCIYCKEIFTKGGVLVTLLGYHGHGI